MPTFLVEELKDLTDSLYNLKPNSRIFEMSKTTLLKHLHDGAVKAGVKDICVHCLRHSYISMCVNNGLPYTTIQKQVGHSEYLQTIHYSHSLKNSGEHLVNALNKIYEG
jgi:site-specific recombinase XerD